MNEKAPASRRGRRLAAITAIALVASRPAAAQGAVELRSERCGQCHIGGNYQPATEKMMPVGDVPDDAKDGIDCLICHSTEYDMNQRHVIRDAYGQRWNQDRSMRRPVGGTHSQ